MVDILSRLRLSELACRESVSCCWEGARFRPSNGHSESDGVRHTSRYKSGYALVSMRAHHDQVSFPFGCAIQDHHFGIPRLGRMCSHQSRASIGAQRRFSLGPELSGSPLTINGFKLTFAEHRLHSDYGKRSRHKVAPVHRVQNKHLRMILASLREHCLGRRPANFESSIASRILMVENACRISHRC